MPVTLTALSKAHDVLWKRIDEIIALVPADFQHREQLEKALKGRQDSIKYTAPEAIGGRWQEVAKILGDYLHNVEAPWAEQIGKIFGADYED